jgi:tetratricopeptide (TPR) repeat protein
MVSTNDEVLNETPVAQMVPVAGEIRNITEEDFEKAQKTFQLGKKNLFLNKIDESVNNIGDACNIYTSKFGEFDAQCAEVYYFYGRALLELARVESTVLGNALNGVPEESGPIDDSRYGNPDDVADDEKEEISEKVIDALCNEDKQAEAATTTEATEATEAPAAAAAVVASETPVAKVAEPEATEAVEPKPAAEENGTAAAAAAAEGEEEGDEGEEDDDEEDGDEDISKNDEQVKDEAEAEEISNLQRSWEMFELAKLVFTKNFENDIPFRNKRIAECLLKLGQISIEQEIYEQAITDITESIRLQEEQKEERDERMLAESFYQLGLAQQFSNLFTEANESYQKSINIVQLRIEKLKAKLTQLGEEAENESERTTVKDEINDLNDLLPEMTSKLEELSEQGQQSMKLVKEAIINNTVGEAAAVPTVTNGEVKDITGLVKSKRKNTEEDSSTIKKTRLSEANEPETTNNGTEQMTA